MVGGDGEFVLGSAGDAEFGGGDGLVLAHRQSGAGFGVGGQFGDDLAGTQPGNGGQPLLHGAGPGQVEQDFPEALVDGDGYVAGGVGPAGDAGVDLAGGDLGGDQQGGLHAGQAGHLHVAGRGMRVQLGAEDRLPGEVEIAGMFEHRPGGDFADAFPRQARTGHQTVEGGGEHVLVAEVRVLGVGAGKRNPVRSHDDNSS